MKQVPILSLNASDMERQPGFKLTKGFLHRMIQAVVYGDALMQCVLATRPIETNRALQMHYVITGLKLRENITSASLRQYNRYIKEIIHDFDNPSTIKMYKTSRWRCRGKFTLNSIQVLTTISMNSLKRRLASLHLVLLGPSSVLRNGWFIVLNTLMVHGYLASLVHWLVKPLNSTACHMLKQ